MGTLVDSQAHGKISLEERQAITILHGDTIEAGISLLSVLIPDRGEYEEAYSLNWKAYREEYAAAVPRMNGLAIEEENLITGGTEGRLGLMQILGRGLSGIVYKAVDDRGFFYAVKTFNQEPDSAAGTLIKREITVAKELEHRYIVPVFDEKRVRYDGITLVMEYAELGTLASYQDIKPATAVSIFCQILEALAYIHSEGFTHRDLKPANVLLRSKNPIHVLVSDFGFTSRDPLRTFCGSHRYCAPEIYSASSKNIPYLNMVDIWSVGIMIIEYCLPKDCLIEPSPWVLKEWFDIIERDRRQPPRIGWERLANLANTMLSHNPYDRPTAETSLSNIDDSSLDDPQRICHLLASEQNHHPAKTYKKIIGDHISMYTLQTWINRDSQKDPPTAINLTKIYYTLGQTRYTMKGDLKGVKHYVLQSKLEASGQKAPRGTYVALDIALVILERRAPFERDLLRSLRELQEEESRADSGHRSISAGIGPSTFPARSPIQPAHLEGTGFSEFDALPPLNSLSGIGFEEFDYPKSFLDALPNSGPV